MPGEQQLPLDQIDQEALFGERKSEPNEARERSLVINTEKNKLEDDSVCEVRFCTGGRLSAPPILHFYDYNMMSAQLIAELPSTDNHLPLIVKILNTMLVEDNFDCGQLHIEEIKEVLLNVHAKWWGPLLQNFPYFLKTDLKGDELTAKENISFTDLPIAKLTIKPLASHIMEPINIKTGKTKIQFVYPRAQNSGIVDEEMKKRFADQEQQFFKIKQMVKAKRTDDVPLADLEAYNDYLAERAKWKLIFTRAQLICAIENELLESLNDRVDALQTEKRISLKHFDLYNKFLENEGAFGLQDTVTFYSETLDQEVTRPFRLHTYTLIPQMDAERNDQDAVSFG